MDISLDSNKATRHEQECQRTLFLVFNLVAQCRRGLCKNNPVENAKPNQPRRYARRDVRINGPLHIWRIPNHGDDEYIEHNVESNKAIDYVSGLEDQRLPFCPSVMQVKGGKTNRNGGFFGVSFQSKIMGGAYLPAIQACPYARRLVTRVYAEPV